VLLADIQEEAAPSASLQAMAAQFTKVTASYGPQVFTCYDVAGLPRTNNRLEQLLAVLRHQLRRATGQKNAPASLWWCAGHPLAGAVGESDPHVYEAELATADLPPWRTVRARGEHTPPAPVLVAVSAGSEAICRAPEESLIQLSLPA